MPRLLLALSLIAAMLGGSNVRAQDAAPTATVHIAVDPARRPDGSRTLGEVTFTTGQQLGPRYFLIRYGPSEDRLSSPEWVAWSLALGDYCRNHPAGVWAILEGPDGQYWSSPGIQVEPGPVRSRTPARVLGFGGEDSEGLLEAVASGGRFTMFLVDDRGYRFNHVIIDTLTPEAREAQYTEAREGLDAADNSQLPLLRVDRVEYTAARMPPPVDPQPCP